MLWPPTETQPVVALSISTCHLFEVFTGTETDKKIFSLTHFTKNQLDHKNPDRLKQLAVNVNRVLEEFSRAGGDLSAATFRLRGGFALDKMTKESLRKNFRNVFKENSLIPSGVRLVEPIEKRLCGSQVSVDIAFLSNKTYIIKSFGGNSDKDKPAGWKDECFPSDAETFFESKIDNFSHKYLTRNGNYVQEFVKNFKNLPLYGINSNNEILMEKVIVSKPTLQTSSDLQSEVAQENKSGEGRVCFSCGKQGSKATCGRCKKVHYCSKACQSSHWKSHKPVCKPAQ